MSQLNSNETSLNSNSQSNTQDKNSNSQFISEVCEFSLNSQESLKAFQKYQDASFKLSFEAININELVKDVNIRLKTIKTRRLVLEAKRSNFLFLKNA